LNPERTCDAPGDDHSVFKVVALIGLRTLQQRQAPISIESRREAVTCVVPQLGHAAVMNLPLELVICFDVAAHSGPFLTAINEWTVADRFPDTIRFALMHRCHDAQVADIA
jgi:hypothetical protein